MFKNTAKLPLQTPACTLPVSKRIFPRLITKIHVISL